MKDIATQRGHGERPTFAETWRSVRLACVMAKLPPPSEGTVVRAIRLRNPRAMDTARYGAKHAREKYEPLRGSFPNADFPLAVVQIDHTPIDLILVSDHDRQPVDRAYLTLVIDVCTRMRRLPHQPDMLPVYVHLALVLMLGLWVPSFLAGWWHGAAAMIGG